MRSKRILAILILMLSVISLFLVVGCRTTTDEKGPDYHAENPHAWPVSIHTLYIGHGDAILIRVGDEYSLIDTGDVEQRPRILQLLKDHQVTSLKRIILTHAHSDHIGGFWAIAQEFPIAHVYDNGYLGTTKAYKTVMRTIKNKAIPYTPLREGMRIDFGDGVYFDVYSPTDRPYQKGNKLDHNNNSVVGKLIYKKFSMLFTGDIEKEEEKRLIKKYNSKLFSRILKVPHHGSNTSSTKDFLRSSKPEAGIISAGYHDQHKLPNAHVLERMKKEDIQIYRTDIQGSVTVWTNGLQWVVETER